MLVDYKGDPAGCGILQQAIPEFSYNGRVEVCPVLGAGRIPTEEIGWIRVGQ